MWFVNATHPNVLKHTVYRALADEGCRKFTENCRIKTNTNIAN